MDPIGKSCGMITGLSGDHGWTISRKDSTLLGKYSSSGASHTSGAQFFTSVVTYFLNSVKKADVQNCYEDKLKLKYIFSFS